MLGHYQCFRSGVTGFYYGTPKARRHAMWIFSSTWAKHYEKEDAFGARPTARCSWPKF